jgi:hypothetical protein
VKRPAVSFDSKLFKLEVSIGKGTGLQLDGMLYVQVDVKGQSQRTKPVTVTPNKEAAWNDRLAL